MPTERRGEDEIRRELAAERERLADALVDLRRGVGEKRKRAGRASGALAAGAAAATVLELVRRLRRRGRRDARRGR